MKKKLIFLVSAIILVAGAAFIYSRIYSRPAPTGEAALRLAADAYSLYGGVNWSLPHAQTLTLGTTTVSGLEVTFAGASSTMAPADIFRPFEEYYASKLWINGWVVDKDLEANGPASGMTVYRKDGQVIVTSYRSEFLNASGNAPAECPCKVSLAVFSAAP